MYELIHQYLEMGTDDWYVTYGIMFRCCVIKDIEMKIDDWYMTGDMTFCFSVIKWERTTCRDSEMKQVQVEHEIMQTVSVTCVFIG